MNWSPNRVDPGLADFEYFAGEGNRILVRRGYEIFAPLLAPGGHMVAQRVADELVSGGRQPHPLIVLPNGERILVRSYRRGGLIRYFNSKYYFRGHRALEELRATVRAGGAGVRVPEVVVAAERRVGLGYTATLATRWIAGAESYEKWVQAATVAERELLLRELGRQIALIHAAGISHPDLTLRNTLVVQPSGQVEPEVYLLDFDRARLSNGPTSPSHRARDLRRLGRSARKLALPLEADEGWVSLRAGYGTGWPLPDRGYRSSANSTFSTT
jgi:3-deoxy-D-manno-octulosonic acid kinase